MALKALIFDFDGLMVDTEQSIFDAYCKKNKVNFERQESGYTEKDHDDSKHI